MREETKVTHFASRIGETGGSGPSGDRGTVDAFDAVALFDADGVDVFQYSDTVQRKAPLEPEKHLLLAILEDAITCYRKNVYSRNAGKQATFREAEEWIFARDDERFLGFESVCSVLGIEPSYLRRGLLEWKRRKAKARADAAAEAA